MEIQIAIVACMETIEIDLILHGNTFFLRGSLSRRVHVHSGHIAILNGVYTFALIALKSLILLC
jgi:hypothetical protein